MKMTVVGVLSALVASCVLTGSATGAPIASESFDYPDGNLPGNDGGSGWDGAWQSGGTPVDVQVLSGGLSHKDSKGVELSVAGNCVKPSGLVKRRINLDTDSRAELKAFVEDGKLGVDGTTIWLGFLAHMENNIAWDFVDLRADEPSKLVLGRDSSSNWGAGEFPSIRMQGKTPATEDVFFVVRIDFKSGDDNLYAWTNPALDAEPAVRDADFTTSRDLAFNSIWMHGSGYDQFDELRIGTFWEDLVRKVEPAPPKPKEQEKKPAGEAEKKAEGEVEKKAPADAEKKDSGADGVKDEREKVSEEKKPLMRLY